VKSSLYFRGRENIHRELGFEVMNRVLKDTQDTAAVEMAPKMMGNSIIMVLGPRSAKFQKPASPMPAPANPVLSPALALSPSSPASS
jgi:hypothetical protein